MKYVIIFLQKILQFLELCILYIVSGISIDLFYTPPPFYNLYCIAITLRVTAGEIYSFLQMIRFITI